MSRQPYTEVTESNHTDGSGDLHGTEALENPEAHARPRWYVEDGMGKRILGFVVVLLVLGLLWYAYQRHVASQVNDGSITVEDTTPRNVGDNTPDAPVVRKTSLPVASTPVTTTAATTPAPAVIPATDSIAPNPTNGMTFAGTGKFQVYRQGNLTWRVDTESGKTCIVFATMEEWRKPIVYEHGCANS